jgi:concanavalin A-like lectin/glucanase superfamily protein
MRHVRLVVGVVMVWIGVAPAGAAASTVALWHMDERSGTTMTDAVGWSTGALHDVTLGVPGAEGTAYRFDRRTSYVTVPSSPLLNPGSARLTFTAHVRYTVTPPNTSTTDYDVLRKGTASDSAQFYKLEIRPDNRAVCRFVGSKTSSKGLLIHTGPALNDGRWHTITCEKTSSQIRLVIDGVVHAKSGTVGSISNTGALTLGAKAGGTASDFYNGDLDEVSVSIG